MKKIALILLLGILVVSCVSASVTFGVQPHAVYNLGDKINTTIEIFPDEPDYSGVVSATLECGPKEVEVYKEFFFINGKLTKEIIVPLVKSLIGNASGSCAISLKLDGKTAVSSGEFEISNSIEVGILGWGEFFNPGDGVTLSGSAIKKNGNNVNGKYKAIIFNETFEGDVTDGNFDIWFTLPENLAAGTHKINLSVVERNNDGEVLNSGTKVSFLNVNQVPRSVEIVLDENELLPGNTIKGKIVLHDQTGKNIPDQEAYLSIKDENGEVEKLILKTDTEFSFATEKDRPPSVFALSVVSEELANNAEVKILENKEVRSEIINNTLFLTNVGNVFYEDNLTLKIGEDEVIIPLSLDLGESETYKISAPDGEYDIVFGNLKKRLTVSGNAVKVEKMEDGLSGFTYFIWIFALVLVCAGAVLVFKKERKRIYFSRRKPKVQLPGETMKEKSTIILTPGKKAELSLAISGKKQNSVVVCLSLKNYAEISSGKGNIVETLGRIFAVVEESKGFIYDNKGQMFFVFAPMFTRTFKNQRTAFETATKIKAILEEHNKKFKQKIQFGIALNHGEIIVKPEPSAIKFMGLGTLMVSSKKLANFSNGEIIASEDFRQNLNEKMNATPVSVGTLNAYVVEGLVNRNDHSTFIKGFLARQERDRQKEQSKE